MRESWENAAVSGGELADDALRGVQDDGTVYRLLCSTWLLNGPKIPVRERKAIAALDGEQAQAFRAGVLGGILREDEALPAPADSLAQGLEGNERKALLFQAAFVSSGSADSRVTENVTAPYGGTGDTAGD